MFQHPFRAVSGRAAVVQGLQRPQSCSFRWIFDDTTHRFRRTPRERPGMARVSRGFGGIPPPQNPRVRGPVRGPALDEGRNRIRRAWLHHYPCQRRGGRTAPTATWSRGRTPGGHGAPMEGGSGAEAARSSILEQEIPMEKSELRVRMSGLGRLRRGPGQLDEEAAANLLQPRPPAATACPPHRSTSTASKPPPRTAAARRPSWGRRSGRPRRGSTSGASRVNWAVRRAGRCGC